MAEENINNKKEEAKEEVKKEEKKRKLPPIKSLLFWGIIFIALLTGAYLLTEKAITPSIDLKKGISSSKVSREKGEVKKTLYALEPLVVNLAEPKTRRYLRVTINLELDGPGALKEVEMLKPCLIDSIITLLSSKTSANIENPEGKISLRREIITSLNKQLTTGRVINVYFTEFIIQ